MKETIPGYQTGPTKPPKTYHRLLAVLLVLVIFLGGLSTCLGILNIRLSRLLASEQETHSPIAFSQDPAANETAQKEGVRYDALGLATETITPFLQSYYDLPAGVYITQVEDGSAAQEAGLFTGDIILAAEDTPTPDPETLVGILSALEKGQCAKLTVLKDKTTQYIRLMPIQESE